MLLFFKRGVHFSVKFKPGAQICICHKMAWLIFTEDPLQEGHYTFGELLTQIQTHFPST